MSTYTIQIHDDGNTREEHAIAVMQTDIIPASFVVGNYFVLHGSELTNYIIESIQHEATITNDPDDNQNSPKLDKHVVRVYLTPHNPENK